MSSRPQEGDAGTQAVNFGALLTAALRDWRAPLRKVMLARVAIEMQDGATQPRSVCLKINELFGESSAVLHTRGPH